MKPKQVIMLSTPCFRSSANETLDGKWYNFRSPRGGETSLCKSDWKCQLSISIGGGGGKVALGIVKWNIQLFISGGGERKMALDLKLPNFHFGGGGGEQSGTYNSEVQLDLKLPNFYFWGGGGRGEGGNGAK